MTENRNLDVDVLEDEIREFRGTDKINEVEFKNNKIKK